MVIERYFDIYRCEICGRCYYSNDMVVYNKLSRKGKCRECVMELESKRRGRKLNIIQVD